MKNVLFNPFEKHSDKKLLCIGLFSILVGAALGYAFDARYDGVFDLHFIEKVTLLNSLTDILITITTTCLMLFLVGKYTNPKTRLIDIFNTCSIAKIPFYLLTVFNSNHWIYNASTKLLSSIHENLMEVPNFSALIPVLLFSLVTIAGLVLTIMLLFNGYKVATNAKGTKSIVLFVAALLLAEIFSKIIISILN
ncbi:hypothetical protein [Flavobacterium sp.]|uniref:hypothetical protein n=1 Tax=Flavobacterium sp. TaxID=239 RepID=UPI00286CF1E7|nr:hypothetical protein [Flavobacterium sp.]